MEAVPGGGGDVADDLVGGVFGGDAAAEGYGEEQAVCCAFAVDGGGDFAGGFPGFRVDVLADVLVWR